MTLRQTHHICVGKVLLSNYFNLSNYLISHIAQFFFIHKFYGFRPGPYIIFKYARYNHLRCLMMGEVSLKT